MPRKPGPLTIAFGQVIEDRRKRLGLTQEQVWRPAGLSSSSYQRIRSGEAKPDIEEIGAIAEVLKTTPSDLLKASQGLVRRNEIQPVNRAAREILRALGIGPGDR